LNIDLSNKTVLITGASGDLGQATTKALSNANARCLLVGRSEERLQQTIPKTAKDKTHLYIVDLTQPNQISSMLDTLEYHVDIVVHCAAPLFQYTKIHQLTQEQIDIQYQVGINSLMQICSILLPKMMFQGWGRIVCAGSLAGAVSGKGSAPYSLVKAAQESYMRSIALEYGRYHICANTLRIGPLDGARLKKRDEEYPGARQKMMNKVPTKRLPTPNQVADIIAFFCSSYIEPVNGATLDVSSAAHLNLGW